MTDYSQEYHYLISVKPFNFKIFGEFDIKTMYLVDARFEKKEVGFIISKTEVETKTNSTAVVKVDVDTKPSYDEVLSEMLKINQNVRSLFQSLTSAQQKKLINFILNNNITRSEPFIESINYSGLLTFRSIEPIPFMNFSLLN